MHYSIVTIFPEMVHTFFGSGLIKKAVEKKIIGIDIYDLREFADNKHKKTDDRPYGGGPGMVMKPEPLANAVNHIQKKKEGKIILFSANAERLSQKKVKKLSEGNHFILICGRYDGVDQRFIDKYVDEEISIGEYVIMGGELAAGVFVESVSRMIEGVIGNRESVETDSFFVDDQYGYPQYTMPRYFEDIGVPDVLVSGDHKKICDWRKKNQKSKNKSK